jgi:beta-glucosidase
MKTTNFPKDFMWGVATSAYQIEGACAVDGRTPSIWDTFCHQPGKVFKGHNGDEACQHYIHWQQDLQLLKELGVNAYRFSIAWPRIFPDASKKINQKGLDFYSKLIDRLLEDGIEPFITLFHWDLPQYIQDEGGWSSRTTCELFRDYAYAVINHFSDRVKFWTTLNEPSVVTFSGHFWGGHAPGIRSPETALLTMHHLLLAHGLAVRAIRSSVEVKLGIALNFSSVFPFNPDSVLDQQAAMLYDTYVYRSFLDALFLKKYPAEMKMDELVKEGDMDIIGTPMDYVGINYYTTSRISYDENAPLFKGRGVPAVPNLHSEIWEFYPPGISLVIERIWKDYSHLPIYILENGTSLADKENDQGRIEYLEAHLQEVERCLKKGIDIRGYFVWSLMDNFEWAEGYSKRFGLIYVDFDTLERKPKASASWYRSMIFRHKGTKSTKKIQK